MVHSSENSPTKEISELVSYLCAVASQFCTGSSYTLKAADNLDLYFWTSCSWDCDSWSISLMARIVYTALALLLWTLVPTPLPSMRSAKANNLCSCVVKCFKKLIWAGRKGTWNIFFSIPITSVIKYIRKPHEHFCWHSLRGTRAKKEGCSLEGIIQTVLLLDVQPQWKPFPMSLRRSIYGHSSGIH